MTNRHRYFIDCIDVLDTRLPPAAATSAPGTGYSSHTDDLLCTLFLFNDRILVAKRDSAEGTGRSIVGLNNINKLVQDMQGKDAALSRSRSPMKGRGKAMRYRGDYDLGEVTANDLGEYGGSALLRMGARQAADTYTNPPSAGFSLFLERAPTEFSERWNGRPLRHFVIIKPERPEDKTRFLSNIWHCIAQNKTEKQGPRAMLLRQNQLSVYWNIYDRRSYLSETRKVRSLRSGLHWMTGAVGCQAKLRRVADAGKDGTTARRNRRLSAPLTIGICSGGSRRGGSLRGRHVRVSRIICNLPCLCRLETDGCVPQ